MKRIFKWSLSDEPGIFTIALPADSEPLVVHAQDNFPCVWINVDDQGPRDTIFTFVTVHTGAEVPFGYYLGSSFFDDDSYVLHTYWYKGVPNGTQS